MGNGCGKRGVAAGSMLQSELMIEGKMKPIIMETLCRCFFSGICSLTTSAGPCHVFKPPRSEAKNCFV